MIKPLIKAGGKNDEKRVDGILKKKINEKYQHAHFL